MDRLFPLLTRCMLLGSASATAWPSSASADTVLPGAGSVQLNGDAEIAGAEFVLTDGASQLSSVWYQAPIALDQPFRVSFQYRAENIRSIVSPGGPGDGFAFVLQRSPAGLAALGQAGDHLGGLGYGGIGNSLGLSILLGTQQMALQRDGGLAPVLNHSDWNSQDSSGQWQHGVPGYPLPPGVDPDASPIGCNIAPMIGATQTCTVGGVEISDLGAVSRLYDHYYVGHGFSNSGDVPINEDEEWYPITLTFLPNLQANDGSLAVLYAVAGVESVTGYLGVADYWYLPGTPIAADNSFYQGLPEYDPTNPAAHYVGFTASTGSLDYSGQRIRNWTIETGIDNTFWQYGLPVPEPSAAVLLALGLLSMAVRQRFRVSAARLCRSRRGARSGLDPTAARPPRPSSPSSSRPSASGPACAR